jgi:hypothetical protein
MSAGDNRLPVLAAEIRSAVADARKSARRALARAMDAGDRLIEAKKSLHHGDWLPWLRDHCSISERTASRYMKLAQHRLVIDAKSATVADLTIKGALQELTEPQWPPQPSHVYAVLRCLPLANRGKVGTLQHMAGEDYFGIAESEALPGFYFVAHIWWPHGEDEPSTCDVLRRPVRADFVHEIIKFHAGDQFADIDFFDVPRSKIADLIDAAGGTQ